MGETGNMATNQKKQIFIIVLVFAILHGLCCIGCRSLGIEDTRSLTLLTIAMAFILAYQRRMKIYYIIAAIIIVIVVAYLIGNAIPLLIIPVFGESIWIYVASTMFTTIVLALLLEIGTDLVLKLNGSGESLKEAPEKMEFRQRWVVRINDRIVPVKTEQIAYFFSEDKSNYLVTFDGGRYLVDATMENILSELDPVRFFRINRGAILSLACIDSAVVDSGRYSVIVHPDIGVAMNVARSRVDNFLKWLQ